jgi:hypothetical protein
MSAQTIGGLVLILAATVISVLYGHSSYIELRHVTLSGLAVRLHAMLAEVQSSLFFFWRYT